MENQKLKTELNNIQDLEKNRSENRELYQIIE